jgi:hypothetical protein
MQAPVIEMPDEFRSHIEADFVAFKGQDLKSKNLIKRDPFGENRSDQRLDARMLIRTSRRG